MEPAGALVGALGLALGVLCPVPATAQFTAQVRPEVRADVIAGRSTATELAAGLALPVGNYVRLAIGAGAGIARSSGRWGQAGRLEVAGRFVVDPFAERHWTVYGAGGLALLYDRFEHWRPALTLLFGIEGPFRYPVAPAFEVGLGGGIRAGFAFRRVRGTAR